MGYTTVMIVNAEALPEAPEAFREYVEAYFAERLIWGKRVFYAERRLSNFRGMQNGVAPSHSFDIKRFKRGLPEGQDLSDWLSYQRYRSADDPAKERFFVEFYAVEHPGGCPIGDD